MKTKVLKSVLPILAIIMAIGLAFATEATNSSQIGYYFDPNTGAIVSTPVDCNSTTQIPCKIDNNQVYAEEELLTPLYKTRQ
ncbi:DUF6520 family protein [Yeosuana marina]|uniref:DUF6520 family protein n=1 Tax=Yeosuana marina TaxID=1565536 RepID=UPI0030C82464